ncbi:acyl-CoA desaturase [Dyadobacter sp. CY323]|uniref:fatty acid desaturase family protein n=1 Tax=Dyadobacter sp. CY323 TaxID=2907302 RepID=UPI001F16EE02|nr:acyl-CoA desaturase [Dyadobacter sp. CY323]MCE6989583.1 acyl-CoA desaturase [Dyadobacter sp. CY323]
MKLKEQVKFIASEKTLFFPTLKKRVDAYFIENNLSKHANHGMVIKTVVLLAVYVLPFIFLLACQPPYWTSMSMWIIMGLGISGIGMSIMHDANHGAYSSNSAVNLCLGYSIYLAGAGVLNWKLQHNVLHHTYTNIVPLDEDIRDRGIVKLSPHAKPKKVHRFQWVYAFFVYGILTLYWVLLKDFIQLVSYTGNGVNKQTRKQNTITLLSLIAMKAIYLAVFFVLPVVVFSMPFKEILAGFLLMHFTAGLVLTIIFQLAHTVEGTVHPKLDETGIIPKDWAIHQLETTVNFSPDNKWLSWYVGGLNYQIEHHLFPKICHVHYPQIAPIVKQTAEEFGLVYRQHPTFWRALQSHVSALKRFGIMSDLNDGIG